MLSNGRRQLLTSSFASAKGEADATGDSGKDEHRFCGSSPKGCHNKYMLPRQASLVKKAEAGRLHKSVLWLHFTFLPSAPVCSSPEARGDNEGVQNLGSYFSIKALIASAR